MAIKEKKRKKVNKKQWIFRMFFLLGLLVLLYPFLSDLYYRVDSNKEIEAYDKEIKSLSEDEINERIGLARAYNDSLNNQITDDPYLREEYDKGREAYARMLEVREKIGHIEIPKINQDLPIYAGTSDEVLEMGVGHLEGTSLPIGGNSTHTVLTAHTGLPQKRLFTDLNKLKIGDKFYIHNIKEILAYQVDQIKVVEPSDFDDLLISPGHDYATLLTCTPIMINSHRLLVRGHRVPYVPAVDEELIADNKANYIYKLLFYLALILIIILIISLIRQYKINRRTEDKIKKLEENGLGGNDEED
ncbi:class C sortase [Anaerococcus sp. AGMB09787]|uniref:class C sortase n=1 Tax=Anaerococcus sp. AGMB09787 TaxID=2922869 RepID=UPI001FB04AD5|nr:class C sortase [Anaerococcus sp. AGMB09787]